MLAETPSSVQRSTGSNQLASGGSCRGKRLGPEPEPHAKYSIIGLTTVNRTKKPINTNIDTIQYIHMDADRYVFTDVYGVCTDLYLSWPMCVLEFPIQSTSRKTNMSLKMGTISIGNTYSNH